MISFKSDFLRALRNSPLTIAAAAVVILLILAVLFAPLIAPYTPFDPASLELFDGRTPPMQPNVYTGNRFWLGADDQGRDVFSTILYGMRISLLVGFSAVCLAAVIGVTLGLVSGYIGGWVDALIMRIADVQVTFPSILIALMIFGVARELTPVEQREEAAILVLTLSIGLSEWVPFARTVRAVTLVEKEKQYVAAARLVGRSRLAILFRHILPNVLSSVLVIGTILLALAIIAEATLSFLGVGAPPTKPSLGTLIRIGQDFLFSGEWWILFFPALTLLLLALSTNLLGDWLRDYFNPQTR